MNYLLYILWYKYLFVLLFIACDNYYEIPIHITPHKMVLVTPLTALCSDN